MLGVNNVTTTTAANTIPKIWSKKALIALRAALIIGDKINTQYREDATRGNTIYIPRISNFEASQKTANNQVVLNAPKDTNVPIYIDQQPHCAFLLEDIAAVQSNLELTAKYTDQAGYAVRKYIDTLLANQATSFSQSTGVYNTPLTASTVLQSDQILNENDVPVNDRYWIIHPKTLTDLRQISDYVRYDGTGYAGGAAWGTIGKTDVHRRPDGLSGMLYNAEVYATTQVMKAGNNISNMFIHEDAMALVMQKELRTQSDYKLEYLAHLVVIDAILGYGILRDEAGVLVMS